eukprot:NODE_162_length_16547_cov_0.334326.p6 type:complete len:239 gc:universal NODE_162_length_16547_cov_0.334326:3209-2493(-)
MRGSNDQMSFDLENLFYIKDNENEIEYVPQSIKCGNYNFDVSVISRHPLWAHYVYNSAMEMSLYIQQNPCLFKHKNVLELGAGVGIPSLTVANFAASVLVTDYPDYDLIEMLNRNFANQHNVKVQGLLWGNELTCKYDVILMADLVFNHSEQEKLLKTIKSSLKLTGFALVFFTSHRPWLRDADLLFFKKAIKLGFKVEFMYSASGYEPVFKEDSPKDRNEDDLAMRSRVDAYTLRVQ